MDLFLDHDQTVLLWFTLFGLLLARAWFGKTPAAGLGLCHLLNLAIIHFFTEFFVGANSSINFTDRIAGQTGFKVTGIAILGLIAAFGTVQFSKKFLLPQKFSPQVIDETVSTKVGYLAIIYGFGTYFVLSKVLSFIPSITSILSSGMALAAAGMAIWYYITLKRNGSVAALAISSFSIMFPICTVLFAGFIGFGVFAVLSLLCFMICLHKPRWQMLVVAPAVIFMGLSLYPAYMKAREEIRRKVWGEADYSERTAATIGGIFDNWEWFDPENENQLASMNNRLNQNVLVGLSYSFLTSGSGQYAEGETLLDGLLALIPRAIWPEKKIKAGSGGMVTRFAGIVVPDSTSIGIGNIMELFVNFGVYGVFVGFLVIGSAVYLLDEACGLSLESGDFRRFILYFTMAQSFMNVIGSFVEWGPSLVGAYVLTLIYQKFAFKTVINKPFE